MTEFKLLTGIELAEVDPENIPWPMDTFGVVAIEDEKIVGRTAILNLPMIEGTFVAPEKRGGSLFYKLLARVEQMYKMLGKTHAWAMVPNDQIADYVERLGYKKVEVTLYCKDLTEAVKKEAA